MLIRLAHLLIELFIMHVSGKQPSPEGMLTAPLDPCLNIHSSICSVGIVCCCCQSGKQPSPEGMPTRFAHSFIELFIMHASGKQPSPEGTLNAPLGTCCNIRSRFM